MLLSLVGQRREKIERNFHCKLRAMSRENVKVSPEVQKKGGKQKSVLDFTALVALNARYVERC